MKNIIKKEQVVKSELNYVRQATQLEKSKVQEIKDKIAKVEDARHNLIVGKPDYSDQPKVVQALNELDSVVANLKKQLKEIRRVYSTDGRLLYIAYRLDDAEKYNKCKSEVDKMSVGLQSFADSLEVFKRKTKEAGLHIESMNMIMIQQTLVNLAENYNSMVAGFRMTDKQLLDEFNRLMAVQEKINFVSDQQKIDRILKSVKEL